MIYNFQDLVNIISILRGETGCPWDKVQTHISLKETLIEETYEVIEAINNNDSENLCEELGDVLLQVVFHSQIEKEKDVFDINNVIDGICNKMINRHPHIFSDKKAQTEQEALDNWEEIKKKEKNYKSQTEILRSIPKSMPALMRAYKIQKKTSKFNDNSDEIIDKIIHKLQELKNLSSSQIDFDDKIGEVLFDLTELSIFFKINPEISLTNAMEKFINKFESIEESANKK